MRPIGAADGRPGPARAGEGWRAAAAAISSQRRAAARAARERRGPWYDVGMSAAPSVFVCPFCGQRYDVAGYCGEDGHAAEAADDPLLGTDVGRYRLARRIGDGGMGRVYLGVQPAIGSRVAIKVLSDACARDPELLERFFAEARAVNLIRHEGIVGVIDLAQLTDGRPYIVMEYIDGQTLAAIGRGGPVPLGGLVRALAEVLSALGAAHAIGIVHRDLKPDNVMVLPDGTVKVLDFGVAKSVADASPVEGGAPGEIVSMFLLPMRQDSIFYAPLRSNTTSVAADARKMPAFHSTVPDSTTGKMPGRMQESITTTDRKARPMNTATRMNSTVRPRLSFSIMLALLRAAIAERPVTAIS